MGLVAVRLLGTEAVRQSTVQVGVICDAWWPLLGCLIAAPAHGLTRNQLATELWPDSDDNAARRSLATALWRIRAHPAAAQTIALAGERVKLERYARWWLDVAAFERRTTAALVHSTLLECRHQRQRLRRALRLYHGEFLPGRMQESIVIERERLRALYLDGLYALARAEAQAGEWEQTCRTTRKLCSAEPLREDAQRLFIEALSRTGCRALALQQYRDLRALLQRELQVAPMQETIALINRLASDHVPFERAQAAAPLDQRIALTQIRTQLTAVLALVDTALAG